MGLFKKKEEPKQEENINITNNMLRAINFDYTNWNNDLGFAVFIMQQELDIAKRYYIEILGKQHVNGNITGDELLNIYKNTVEESVKKLSDNYILFLTTKYFRDFEELVEWMSQYIYDKIISAAVSSNVDRVKSEHQKEFTNRIMQLNGSTIKDLAKKITSTANKKYSTKIKEN